MTFYISPYRRLASLRQAMDRVLDDSLTEQTTNDREMLLAVDVKAEDDDYLITALIPGLDPDDINIEVLNNTVSIRGEFKSEASEDSKYLMCELPAGRFSRIIQLPTAADPGKTEASIKNGILKLRVPKAESHRPKTIKISNS